MRESCTTAFFREREGGGKAAVLFARCRKVRARRQFLDVIRSGGDRIEVAFKQFHIETQTDGIDPTIELLDDQRVDIALGRNDCFLIEEGRADLPLSIV